MILGIKLPYNKMFQYSDNYTSQADTQYQICHRKLKSIKSKVNYTEEKKAEMYKK